MASIVFDPFDSPFQLNAAAQRGSEGGSAGTPGGAAETPLAPPPTHAPCSDLKATVDAFEKGLIEAAFTRCRYNQRATAASLGLTYDQVRHAMKKHGIAA